MGGFAESGTLIKNQFIRITAVIICWILLSGKMGFAQQKKADSLLAELSKAPRDTGYVNMLVTLGKALVQAGKYDSALMYSVYAVKVADSLHYDSGAALARYIQASLLGRQYRYTESKSALSDAIKRWRQSGDEKNLAIANTLMASLYGIEENYAEGLKLYYENLPLLERLKDTLSWVTTLNGIGTAYYLQNNYDESLKAYNKALILAEAGGLRPEVAKTNSDIGGVYFKQGKYDSAEIWCNKALSIYEALQDQWGISYANSVLGNIYEKQGELFKLAGAKVQSNLKYQQALSKYYSMYAMLRTQQDTDGIAEACLYLGNLFSQLHTTDSARRYLNDCLRYSLAIGKKQYARDAYLGLYRIDSSQLLYKAALLNFKNFTIYRDSIINEESLRKSDQYRARYELDKKEDELKLLSAENKLKTLSAQKENQRKNIAIAGIGLIILMGTYGFYWFRKKKQLQNQQSLLSERLRISRELHDEVGATLSGVCMYSHLTQTQLQSSDLAGVENSLNIIQESSAQMVNKLNDIVWLINPDKSSLPDLMQRLEEYTRNMAAAKNMEVKVNISQAIAQPELSMELRRNIYLFCKEAINNAVKYSGGTLVELSVKEDGHLIEFSISDNGKGFDPGKVKPGNGLISLQQRAEEMGTGCSIFSGSGKGTRISCKINTDLPTV